MGWVPLGIAVGPVVGREIGVFDFVWVAIWSGPGQCHLGPVLRVGPLCDIGFTMSLFIGLLALPHPPRSRRQQDWRLAGSVISDLVSALLPRLPRPELLRAYAIQPQGAIRESKEASYPATVLFPKAGFSPDHHRQGWSGPRSRRGLTDPAKCRRLGAAGWQSMITPEGRLLARGRP